MKKGTSLKNCVWTLRRIISVLAMIYAVPAHAITEDACDKAWGDWDKSSKTCLCGSTKQEINGPSTAAKCRADHARSWNSSAHEKTNPEGSCGTTIPENPNLQCPKQLLQQIVQSSSSSSVFGLVGAPDKECNAALDEKFKKPEDLERALANDPKYSIGANPDLLSGSCLSDWQEYRGANSPKVKLADHPAKQAVATYYYLSDRLNRGTQGTMESIASTDSILGQPPLNNVNCSDPYLKKPEQWCADFRKKNCSAQGGLDELAQETVDKVQIYDQVNQEEEQIKQHPSGPPVGVGQATHLDLSPEQKARLETLDDVNEAVLSQYPWIAGQEFQKYLGDHSASNFKKFVGKDNHPEYNPQVIHDALYSQLKRDRDASLQRLDRFKRVGKCLNQSLFQFDSCKDFDDVIGETPPLNEVDLVGKDAQCRWDVDMKKSKVNHRFSNIVQGVVTTGAITVVTMGFGTAAAVGELGLGEAVANANTAKNVIQGTAKAIQAAKVARILTGGINLSFIASGAKNAYDTCTNTLIRLDHAANDSTQLSCPAKAGTDRPGSPNASAKMTSDCTIAIALSAANLLPLATPALKKLVAAAGDLGKVANAAEENGNILAGGATDAERLAFADTLRGKPYNPDQQKAIIDAHNVGQGEPGLDGTPARRGNYTQTQLQKKARILKDAEIPANDRRELMENGVVGNGDLSPEEYKRLNRTAQATMEMDIIRSRPSTITIHHEGRPDEVINAPLGFSQSNSKEIKVGSRTISLEDDAVTIQQGGKKAAFPKKPGTSGAPVAAAHDPLIAKATSEPNNPTHFTNPRDLEAFMKANPNRSITISSAYGQKMEAGASLHPAENGKPAYIEYEGFDPSRGRTVTKTVPEKDWGNFEMSFQKQSKITTMSDVPGSTDKQWLSSDLVNQLKQQKNTIKIIGKDGKTISGTFKEVRYDGAIFVTTSGGSVQALTAPAIKEVEISQWVPVFGPLPKP